MTELYSGLVLADLLEVVTELFWSCCRLLVEEVADCEITFPEADLLDVDEIGETPEYVETPLADLLSVPPPPPPEMVAPPLRDVAEVFMLFAFQFDDMVLGLSLLPYPE